MPRPGVDGLRWTKPERGGSAVEDKATAARSSATRRNQMLRNLRVIAPSGVACFRLVDGLAAWVAEATDRIGQPPPKRRFTGHMTVARFRRDPPSGQWPPEGLPTIDASFTASAMTLVRVEPSGAYVDVEQFALGPHSDPPQA